MDAPSVAITAGTKKNPLRKRIIKNLSAWGLIVPALLLMYFFTIRPIITGIWYSFHDMQGYTVLKFTGLKNYVNILSDTRFLMVLGNTIKYVIWSFIIGFLPPLIAAIMLNEMVHLRSAFKFMFYLPCMVPALATSLIWQYLYMPDISGVLNILLSYVGIEPQPWLQNGSWTIPLITVSMTWGAFGSSTIMYLAALQGINGELYEAAALDGAGFLNRVIHITLPSLSKMLILFAAQQIISVFQVSQQPLAMTGGGPNNASMSLGLWSYYNGFISFNTEASLATGVITFLLLLIFTSFYFVLQRRLERE